MEGPLNPLAGRAVHPMRVSVGLGQLDQRDIGCPTALQHLCKDRTGSYCVLSRPLATWDPNSSVDFI